MGKKVPKEENSTSITSEPNSSSSSTYKTLVDEMAALDPSTELVEYKEPSLPPPPSFKTVLWEFLKMMSVSSTDLHRLNCPALLISGVSILEYVQHWGDHPELLTAISACEDAQDRIKAVAKWVLSTLWGSFASRTPTSGFERKPYNPILGEQFFGWWPEDGQEMMVEQVSHHPPISAFYLMNRKAGVHVNGYSGQATKFTGSAIRYQQPGRVYLYVEKYNEEYSISLPELHIRGLVNGQPFVEITGAIDILGTNDWAARIRFIPKPWFSGVYDMMEGVIFNNMSGATVYDLWGNWKKTIYCAQHQPGRTLDDLVSLPESPDDPSFVFYDIEHSPPRKPMVRPLSKQGDLESQKIWLLVTQALQSKAYKHASDLKNAIEEQERALRKERAARNETWDPILFRFESFGFMPNVEKENHQSTSPVLSILSDESVSAELKKEIAGQMEDDPQSSMSEAEAPEKEEPTMPIPGRWIYRPFYDEFINCSNGNETIN
jgi:hypothetical protein